MYQRRAVFNKLSAFHAMLEQAPKVDLLLAQIKAEGYGGGYSQLTAGLALRQAFATSVGRQVPHLRGLAHQQRAVEVSAGAQVFGGQGNAL